MEPPMKARTIFLCLPLVLSLVSSMPTSADPQLDEIHQAMSRQLDARAELKAARLAAAALKRESARLIPPPDDTQPAARVAAQPARMSCRSASDVALECLVVATPPDVPDKLRAGGLAAVGP